jgi:hypothetical protein
MPGLRVLFLGGTGIIRSACSWLAVEPGYRAVIPFEHGARETVAWHDEDGSRQRIDAGVDALSDKLAQAWRPGS